MYTTCDIQNQLIRRLTYFALLFIFIPLASCTNNASQEPQKKTQQGFVFSDFTARQFQQDGKLSNTLSGSKITHIPSQKHYILENPVGVTQQGEIWTISANQATSNEKFTDIAWQHNVVISSMAPHIKTIKTAWLQQRPNQGLLFGDKTVIFNSAMGEIQAQGFVVDTNKHTLNLSGGTLGHYKPATN